MTTSVPAYRLNDGSTLPVIGFGTYPMTGRECHRAVLSALEVGYRLLDSAVNYGNEADVGRAVRDSGLPRGQVQVTTKIPGRAHQRARAVEQVERSLQALGLDHLDLVLIHWPNPGVGRYVEAWEGLLDARQRGLTTSVGVSNFTERHLQDVIDATGVVPAVNQIECHPLFPQQQMLAVDDRLGIRTQAWSPLGKASAPYDAAPVARAAQAHGVAPAQVILRWHLQRGTLPLPKSSSPQRQRQNIDLLGFELTDDEVGAITGLGRADGRLFGGDPEVHEEQ